MQQSVKQKFYLGLFIVISTLVLIISLYFIGNRQNLFGKTFLPQKTNKFLSKFKPSKPKTRYTLDKLSSYEIEFYVKKLN